MEIISAKEGKKILKDLKDLISKWNSSVDPSLYYTEITSATLAIQYIEELEYLKVGLLEDVSNLFRKLDKMTQKSLQEQLKANEEIL